MVINNTGYSSIKIFCESQNANISLASARKIWNIQAPIVLSANSNIRMLCSIESCSIPLSFYMVNETNNAYNFNGTIGTIPNGNYNATTFCAIMNTQQKIFVFSFLKDISKFSLQGAAGSNKILRIDNNIYKLFGVSLKDIEFVEWNTLTPYIPTGVCNLIYTSGLYVSLNNFQNSNIDCGSKTQSSTNLLRIPISQPSNTYLHYFNNVGFKTLLSGSVLNQIDISLLDDNRNLLQLSENVDWVIVLRIDFERTVLEIQETTKINQMRHSKI